MIAVQERREKDVVKNGEKSKNVLGRDLSRISESVTIVTVCHRHPTVSSLPVCSSDASAPSKSHVYPH